MNSFHSATHRVHPDRSARFARCARSLAALAQRSFQHEPFLCVLDTSSNYFGPSWGHFGAMFSALGPTWPILPPSRAVWASSRAVLVPTWRVLAPSWAVWAPSRSVLAPSCGRLDLDKTALAPKKTLKFLGFSNILVDLYIFESLAYLGAS